MNIPKKLASLIIFGFIAFIGVLVYTVKPPVPERPEPVKAGNTVVWIGKAAFIVSWDEKGNETLQRDHTLDN